MLALLLGLFRLIWLFGKDQHAVMMEKLALRQQLAIYKRRHPTTEWAAQQVVEAFFERAQQNVF